MCLSINRTVTHMQGMLRALMQASTITDADFWLQSGCSFLSSAQTTQCLFSWKQTETWSCLFVSTPFQSISPQIRLRLSGIAPQNWCIASCLSNWVSGFISGCSRGVCWVTVFPECSCDYIQQPGFFKLTPLFTGASFLPNHDTCVATNSKSSFI